MEQRCTVLTAKTHTGAGVVAVGVVQGCVRHVGRMRNPPAFTSWRRYQIDATCKKACACASFGSVD